MITDIEADCIICGGPMVRCQEGTYLMCIECGETVDINDLVEEE